MNTDQFERRSVDPSWTMNNALAEIAAHSHAVRSLAARARDSVAKIAESDFHKAMKNLSASIIG